MIPTLATLVTLSLGAAPEPEPSDWTTDAEGRTFRVGFDPGNRYAVGASAQWDPSSGTIAPTVDSAWLIRNESDGGDAHWKLSHHLLEGELEIARTLAGEATLYRLEALRWSRDGAIIIPTSPPTRIAFPADIGFALDVGRLAVDQSRATLPTEVGIFGTEILFDFWRSPRSGSYFVLGVGAHYDLSLGEDDFVLHRVTPFSAARLTLHHEWCQGKQLFEISAGAATAWTSDSGRWLDSGHAELAWEWTFLALNDRPLALRISGRWRYDEPFAAGDGDGHRLDVATGLRLGL